MIIAANWKQSSFGSELDKILIRRCIKSGNIISMIQKTTLEVETDSIFESDKFFVTVYTDPFDDDTIESSVFNNIISCQIWSNNLLKKNNIFYYEPYLIENLKESCW